MDVNRIKTWTRDVDIAAVMLSRMPKENGKPGNFHLGIALRNPDDDETYVFHFAWDRMLLYERADGHAHFRWPLFLLPDARDAHLKLVRSLCHEILWCNTKCEVSYFTGLYPEADSWIDDYYIYRATDERIGLNCVAMVLKVFEKVKIPLVNLADWPPRPDRDAPQQLWLISMMQQLAAQPSSRITQDQIDFSIAHLGTRWVAPEEAAGACLEPSDALGAPWQRCQENGDAIVELIDRLAYGRRNDLPIAQVPTQPRPFNYELGDS